MRVSIASPLMQPSPNGRRVGIRIVTFEACSGFTALQPVGSLSRPRRPLSRGSSPSGHPDEPLVSYQINRQLSGWIPPPLVIRAVGAHCQKATSACYSITSAAPARSEGGTSRPSAFAVLRLTSNAKVVAWFTGKSDGLAPFKILST